ncbi:MAG: peptidylprolyl isomerase [Nanoarchaeota archaeon]
MTITKNDFIELAFTAKTNGKIFDTTNTNEAKEIGIEMEVKPLIISVGNDMVLKGFEEALPHKEIGKKYTVHLAPDKAFGKRNPQLLRTYSLASFQKNNVNPYPGLTLQLDQALAKVISVTGGRVMVDFNNPLAGKEVDYDFTIVRKIDDEKEKVNALQDYFFRQRFDFVINNKKVTFKDPIVKIFLDILGDKFKSMTGLEFAVQEKEEKKEEKNTEENKEKETKDKK